MPRMRRALLAAMLLSMPAVAQNRDVSALRAPPMPRPPLERIDLDLDALVGPAPEPPAPAPHYLHCLVTAYTDHDPEDIAAGYGQGITATGTRTASHPYGIAADPRAIPFGMRMRVPGYRGGTWQAVDDTGGRLRRSWASGVIHLDVRFKTRYSALAWGVRWLDVEIEP